MEFPSVSQACALLLALILCGPTAFCAQSPEQAGTIADPPVATPTITASADLVIVPVLVRGAEGTLRQTFRASDYVLTDNGLPQTVTLEETERQPLSVVVLMQTGASAPRQFPAYARLGTMLAYLFGSSPYQIAMVTFDSQPEELWDFTSDLADLEDGFAKPSPGDDKAAILDAIGRAIDLLGKQPTNRRRVIVLLSQTHDDGSHAHTEGIVKRLGENNVTIECLTFSPEKDWVKDQFTKPRHENPPYQYSSEIPPLLHTINLDQPLRIALSALRENTSSTVAALSGGEAFPFTSRADVEQQIAVLANHFAATATLSFRPTSKQAGFHSLQVHIAGRPDLQVSARTSYWASGHPAR